MNSDRSIAITVGILFITATAAGVGAVGMTTPIMNAPDLLVKVSENANQVFLGALLEFVMGLACAGIAIWLYPVLRKQDEALALASAGFRTIEGVLFCVAAAGLPTLLALSQEYVKAGAAEAAYLQTLAAVVKAGADWLFSGAGAIAFCLGALMYYYVFFRSKLIPRWLSGWGLIAIAMHLVSISLTMFGGDSLSTATTVLNLPIFLNELVLAVWLIVKGFNPSVLASALDGGRT